MTTRYVDAAFAAQGATKIWSTGTASETPAGANWYSTIGAALTASVDDDLIRVAGGTYQILTASSPIPRVTIACLPNTILDFTNATAAKNVRVFRGRVVPNRGVGAPVPTLTLDGAWCFDEVSEVDAQVSLAHTGRLIVIGAAPVTLTKSGDAGFERYPAWPAVGRWPTNRPIAKYRRVGVLEAPAKYRDSTGQQRTEWVPVRSFRYMLDERNGNESELGAVAVGSQNSFLYAMPGPPFHNDMRITTESRVLQIKGVARPNSQGDDVRLTVSEVTRMKS